MSIQTDENFIVEGTVVTYNGSLYYVTKVNPKNFKVIDETGQGWNLRRTAMVKRAPDQDGWTGERPNNYTRYMESVNSGLTLGVAVEFTGIADRRKYPGVYVVVGHTNGKWRVAKLGGDGGAYVRGITASDVRVVNGTFNIQREED